MYAKNANIIRATATGHGVQFGSVVNALGFHPIGPGLIPAVATRFLYWRPLTKEHISANFPERRQMAPAKPATCVIQSPQRVAHDLCPKNRSSNSG